MAERFRVWRQNRSQSAKAVNGGPDIAVAPARRWALGLMVVASAGALLATSAPIENVYTFDVTSERTQTTLTPSGALARYLVRARATALGPSGVDTTRSAVATVRAVIITNADVPKPSVRARFGEPGKPNASVSSVEGSLQLSQPLSFVGDCADPAQATPCEAELELDFDFDQPSVLAADAIVSWTVDFESKVPKPEGGEEQASFAPPWTIEIVKLAAP